MFFFYLKSDHNLTKTLEPKQRDELIKPPHVFELKLKGKLIYLVLLSYCRLAYRVLCVFLYLMNTQIHCSWAKWTVLLQRSASVPCLNIYSPISQYWEFFFFLAFWLPFIFYTQTNRQAGGWGRLPTRTKLLCQFRTIKCVFSFW